MRHLQDHKWLRINLVEVRKLYREILINLSNKLFRDGCFYNYKDGDNL